MPLLISGESGSGNHFLGILICVLNDKYIFLQYKDE